MNYNQTDDDEEHVLEFFTRIHLMGIPLDIVKETLLKIPHPNLQPARVLELLGQVYQVKNHQVKNHQVKN